VLGCHHGLDAGWKSGSQPHTPGCAVGQANSKPRGSSASGTMLQGQPPMPQP
jgi:hypothetical protein